VSKLGYLLAVRVGNIMMHIHRHRPPRRQFRTESRLADGILAVRNWRRRVM